MSKFDQAKMLLKVKKLQKELQNNKQVPDLFCKSGWSL